MPSDDLIDGQAELAGIDPNAPFLPRLAPAPVRPAPPRPAVDALPDAGELPDGVPGTMPPGWAATRPVPTSPPAWAKRKRRSRTGRILKATMLLAVAAVVVVVAIGAVQRMREGDIALPTYPTAPPAHGTVVSVVQEGGDAAPRLTLTQNAAGTTVAMAVWAQAGQPSGREAVASGSVGYFRESAAEPWQQTDATGAQIWAVAELGQLRMFADYVPEVARPYVSVRSAADHVLFGREVRRFELIVSVGDLARDHAAEYQQWFWGRSTDLMAAGALARMVLWVDDAGVVWQAETWSDTDPIGSKFVVALASYSAEEFAPQFPPA